MLRACTANARALPQINAPSISAPVPPRPHITSTIKPALGSSLAHLLSALVHEALRHALGDTVIVGETQQLPVPLSLWRHRQGRPRPGWEGMRVAVRPARGVRSAAHLLPACCRPSAFECFLPWRSACNPPPAALNSRLWHPPASPPRRAAAAGPTVSPTPAEPAALRWDSGAVGWLPPAWTSASST